MTQNLQLVEAKPPVCLAKWFFSGQISSMSSGRIDAHAGCGLVIPTCLEGLRVLDLGSGSGRDVYVLAQLVGPKGSVIGVDMTEEQLKVWRLSLQKSRTVAGGGEAP